MATPQEFQKQLRQRFARAWGDTGLTQAQAGERLGLSEGTISKKIRGELPVKQRDVDAMERLAEQSNRPAGTTRGPENGAESNGNGSSGPRLPIAALMRLPSVRAWLNAFQAELIQRGATPEQEESVMGTLRDRQFVARFAGGTENDQYTEAEVIRAMENIAEAARRFLSGPTL